MGLAETVLELHCCSLGLLPPNFSAFALSLPWVRLRSDLMVLPTPLPPPNFLHSHSLIPS